MIILTREGADHMFLPKLVSESGSNPHQEYWAPLIDELDSLLESV